jgi:PAS domain S-box-containing protein
VSLALPETVHVLHVDDEPDLTELTATVLEREDDRFRVETATSASNGLDRIEETVPDCIVSDYNMPRMDGIEFLRRVREDHPDLPFILYTGKGSEEVASDAISAGVTDYLQKRSGAGQYELLANRIRNAVRARREARRAQRQEELMRLTEFAGDVGGFELDHDTGELILTGGASRLTGLSRNDSHSLADLLALYPPAERTEVRTAIDRAVETGQERQGTWWIQPDDGEKRLLSVTMVPVDETGTATKLRGAISDITEQRQRRRELEQIETLFQHAQDALFLVDVGEQFTIERVNPAYEETTDLPAERICGQTLREIFGEQEGGAIEARYRECVDQRAPLQYSEQLHIGEQTTHWETRIAPVILDDSVEYIVGATRNVTEQRERKKQLEAERRLVQQALDTLEDLFYVLDVDGSFRRWNERVEEVTGYTEGELADMAAIELFPADDRETIEEAVAATLAGDRLTAEADLLTADGTRIPYEFTGARLTDGDGTTTGLVGVGRDLTERRQRQRRFQALVEESNDIISVVDAEGRYQYQSPSLERILGYDPEETLGDEAWEYIHPDDREQVRETFAEWVADPDLAGEIRYRARHADGSWRWMEAHGNNQLDNPAVEGYVVNSRDITEQTRRRRQLERQNERLEEFASLVSHDLRNPLQVARGRLELASAETDSPHLADALDAIERSETLIDDLLSLAREEEPVEETEPVRLDTLAEQAWKTVETGDATLELATDRTLQANRSRLRQLLENLFANAVEHASTSGHPETDAVTQVARAVTVTVEDIPDGFAVEDNGPGIPEADREAVFEAGYSTRHGGTGFGLRIVDQVATSHDWRVSLAEGTEGGARFEITGVESVE